MGPGIRVDTSKSKEGAAVAVAPGPEAAEEPVTA
jgi:hypothetical protein